MWGWYRTRHARPRGMPLPSPHHPDPHEPTLPHAPRATRVPTRPVARSLALSARTRRAHGPARPTSRPYRIGLARGGEWHRIEGRATPSHPQTTHHATATRSRALSRSLASSRSLRRGHVNNVTTLALSAYVATRNKSVARHIVQAYLSCKSTPSPFTANGATMFYPIAYADRLANRTLCPSCAFTRIAMDDTDESGPIMRYDLDPSDPCPCDVCGELCAPDNVAPADAE